jgi:hypothetical protein
MRSGSFTDCAFIGGKNAMKKWIIAGALIILVDRSTDGHIRSDQSHDGSTLPESAEEVEQPLVEVLVPQQTGLPAVKP